MELVETDKAGATLGMAEKREEKQSTAPESKELGKAPVEVRSRLRRWETALLGPARTHQ